MFSVKTQIFQATTTNCEPILITLWSKYTLYNETLYFDYSANLAIQICKHDCETNTKMHIEHIATIIPEVRLFFIPEMNIWWWNFGI